MSEPDLAWLADYPLFIDDQQVCGFHDAVIGPAFRLVRRELTRSESGERERSSSVKLGAGVAALFPWLRAEAELGRGTSARQQKGQGESLVWQPVESASRLLVELVLHYMHNQPERICAIGPDDRIPGHDAIGKSPRMLAFLDAGPASKFLPQAAELDAGRVVTFFDPLIQAFQEPGGLLPPGPSGDRYWQWFFARWNADKAVKVVEDTIGNGGRPRWMAYRVLLSSGKTLNVNIAARGHYDTGTFAYDVIRRGWRYGLRIVGSLKSHPTLSVMAMYDK